MPKKTERNSLVYESLRQAIIEQALKPGLKLPEDAIGETFGVSRTTVKNAFVRLEAEGLVELRPNRGAAVAAPTLEEAQDIFDVRRCLEREVMTRLCATPSAEIVSALRAHVAEEEKSLRTDSARSIRLAGEFHILLAELTGSRILANYVNEIASRCSLILARFARPHSAQCGVEEHTAIIAAIERGDSDTAVGCMDRHLRSVQERALLNSEEREPDVSQILRRYT